MATSASVEREFYSSREVETLTGLSHAGVWRAATRGEIPSLRIGKRILFPKRGIEKLIADAVKHMEVTQDDPSAA